MDKKQLPKSGVVDLKRVESILKEESCHHRGSRRRRVVSEEQSFQRNLGQLFFATPLCRRRCSFLTLYGYGLFNGYLSTTAKKGLFEVTSLPFMMFNDPTPLAGAATQPKKE